MGTANLEIVRGRALKSAHHSAVAQVSNHALRSAPRRALRSVVLGCRWLRACAIDKYLRIHTVGPRITPKIRFDDAVHYETTDYALLRMFLRPLKLNPDDVMYDIGCGMGRILCMFARRPIGGCVGIEVHPTLANIASQNAQQLRGRKCEIEIRQIDALEADYDDATIIWMNNPFGRQTFELFIERMRESLHRRPRCLRIAYIYPRFEDLVADAGFQQFAEVRSPFFSTCRASYWRSHT